jgi:hypothetical protein
MKGKAMNPTVYLVTKWAGALGAILVLGGFSVRLSKIEDNADKVPGIEHHIRIQTIYMKLTDSTKFNLAVELAK